MIRRPLFSAVAAILATLVLATNVLAAPPVWTTPLNVRTKTNIFPGDADFSSTRVAIVWDEPSPGGQRVGLRTSTNSGDTFDTSIFIADSENPAVEICAGGTASDLAYQREVAPGVWNVQYTPIGFGAGSFVQHSVAPGPTTQHDADVACLGGMASVVWYEEVSEGVDNMFVAYGSRVSGTFGTPIPLGTNNNTLFFGSLAVAAADGYTYEVFTRSNGDLRFQRSTVSGGSTPVVTPISTQVIANGSSNNQASGAVIAANGSKVAVVWSRCQDIFGRVSNDHGATWGPVRTLFDEFNSCEADAAASQDSVAIRDGRIAVSYGIASAFGGGENHLIRTSTDFASFTDDALGNPFHQVELIGYVTVDGSRKLADAFRKGFDEVRFRRQL